MAGSAAGAVVSYVAMNVSQIYDADTDPVEMNIEMEKAAN
jgi:hypothetical protein